ncbi:WD domain, G-beta repeat family protein [Theileria equi strain WA]|uniref:WD domain, G-beta repeat family protein n=1 Tax=Theileria equi strain WA TaxID=1537102 RepID=L0B0Y2_THEEQ|nr:WD domain, G-beta repeat family protein [Theileria equi strain WA]AFZ81522.1 WD domain, G-beta repeat family protein [Theileria equi strain WA]|eukprot:XP_004831188.1 WD domain, G-beta repeat family protein [Theileria equi strain WA]
MAFFTNTKFLGSAVLFITILLNTALIGFVVYLHSVAYNRFLSFIVTDSTFGTTSIIGACIGLYGFLSGNISALSTEFYHAIVSVVFTSGLTALHVVSAQYLSPTIKDYDSLFNCFYLTSGAFILMAIANAYVALLIGRFMKENSEARENNKLSTHENNSDKFYDTCKLNETTYSTQV